MERVDPAIFALRPPQEIAAALEAAGLSPAEVHTAPEGTSHLVTATR